MMHSIDKRRKPCLSKRTLKQIKFAAELSLQQNKLYKEGNEYNEIYPFL